MDEVGSVEVVIKGGRPWGFTLRGGIESKTALTVAEIEPRGRADRQGSLKVGDHVLKINDVQCFSLADATQLIDCAFRTLTVLVWRSKSVVGSSVGPICESVRSSVPRRSRTAAADDGFVVRRTSAITSKLGIPRAMSKYLRCRPLFTGSETESEPRVTLTCDSHQDRAKDDSLEDQTYLTGFGPGPQSVTTSASRHSSGSSSTVGNQKDVFQTSDVVVRPSRSPRNLTKDSGYETSAQDHDYVNVEWINNRELENSTKHMSPTDNAVPNHKHYANRLLPSGEERYDHFTKHNLSPSCQSPSGSERCEQNLPSRYDPLPDSHYGGYKESGIRPRPLVAPVGKRSGSYGSLCSSSESLASQPVKPDVKSIRSAKSSLSLSDAKSKSIQQVPSNVQHVVASCQYFNSPVSPAKSTPNLHYQGDMVSLRANKKQSIYEELACKSGFDFSPMVQRQPSWVQKNNPFNAHSFSRNVYQKSYSCDEGTQQPRSLPANCDKVKASENVGSYYANIEHFRSFKQSADSSEYPNLPPPVPTRESSLRYRSNTAHEKYPSWPANLPAEEENAASVQSPGQRSSSWTEQSRYVRDQNGAYSRPKSQYQISTQHLPPVQEKSKKSTCKGSSEISNELLYDSSLATRDNKHGMDVLTTSLNNYVRQQNKSSLVGKKRYDTHSPPERDSTVSLETKNHRNNQSDSNLSFRLEPRLSRPDSRGFGRYENYGDCNNGNNNNSNTPLLDMLRMERENMPSAWSQQEEKACSDAGIYTGGSDSGSEETLKWHGSYSDISSLNTLKRNPSPSVESECSTIYDELNVVSVDSSVKSYSSSPSESSSFDLTNRTNQKQYPYARQHSENDGLVANRELEERVQQLRNRRYSSRSSSESLRSFNGIVDYSRYTAESSCEQSFSTTTVQSRNANEEMRQSLSDTWQKDDGSSSRMLADRLRPRDFDSEAPSSLPVTSHESLAAEKAQPGTPSASRDGRGGRYMASYRPSQKSPDSKSCQGSSGDTSPPSWDLKAIQKQAVLSFYHRQTASAAKDNQTKKAPRSLSFSYGRDCAVADGPVPHASSPTTTDKKRFPSSNSFSRGHVPYSRSVQSSSRPVSGNGQHSVSEHRHMSAPGPSASLPSSPAASRTDIPHYIATDSDHREPGDGRPGCGEDAANQVLQTSKEPVEQPSYSESEKSQKSHGPGRKALLKKIYSPNETAVVKVVSSQGETLAKSVIETRNRPEAPAPKPQVPPKRTRSSSVSVPSPADGTYPEGPPTSPGSVKEEEEDEEELRVLENSSPPAPSLEKENRQSSASVTSCSPDLPLPPLPHSTETEVLPTDDPFPPPPDFLEFPAPETRNRTSCCLRGDEDDGNCHALPYSETCHSETRPSDSFSTESVRMQSGNAITEISAISESRGRAGPPPSFVDSSPGSTLRTSLDSSLEDTGNRKADKHGESEAIYVNLDFRNRLYRSLVHEKTQKPLSATSACVSVTNTATQTSDTSPSLQRKHVESGRTAKSFESTKNFTTDGQVSSLIVPVPSLSNNCNEGNPETENSEGTSYSKEGIFLSQPRLFSFETGSSDKDINQRDSTCIPLTNPYFTTSEPKAKLLTRYCQSFEKEWANQLELKGQKEVLTESISKKLNILRLEQIELQEEMKQNEELGQEVTAKIEKLAKPNELQKYKVHVEELEKIIKLLMSLSGRLARAENALLILPEDANSEEKSFLEAKRNKLSQQHDEAWHLKENIDRRSCQVSYFLHHYLSREEYADYEHFIKMKSKLLMDAIEVDEKIKLGEEQLAALHGTFQAQQKSETVNTSSENLTVLGEI